MENAKELITKKIDFMKVTDYFSSLEELLSNMCRQRSRISCISILKCLNDISDALKQNQDLEENSTCFIKWNEENKVQELKGIAEISIMGIRLLKQSILELKVALGYGNDEENAILEFAESGKTVLPTYENFLTFILNTIKELLTFDIVDIIDNMAEARLYVNKFDAPDKPFCSPDMAILLAECCGFAYDGYDNSFKKVQPIKKQLLPNTNAFSLYEESSGLLALPNGLKVWFGEYKHDVIVSFAGTDIKDAGTIATDAQQLFMPCMTYLCAAGLLKEISDHFSGRSIYVTGHSLGGGLAQFSTAANIARGNLCCVGFNSAGLSIQSLKSIGNLKLSESSKYIVHYTTIYDPVSVFGTLIGHKEKLPAVKGFFPGHTLSAVKKCLESYSKAHLQSGNISGNGEIVECMCVEARAIPSPGYMGFQNANHIYVVEKDTHEYHWGCFGRTYSQNDGSKVVCDTRLYKSWAMSFDYPPCGSGSNPQGGVVNTLSGTCHTLANRLLAISPDVNASVAQSPDDAYSVLVWGKYGFGQKQFLKMLDDSFSMANKNDAHMDEQILQEVKTKVSNPYEDELDAWCCVIYNLTGIDAKTFIDSNQIMHDAATYALTLYCVNREDLFVAHFTDNLTSIPSDSEKKSFWTDMEEHAIQWTSLILQMMVKYGIINENQKNIVEAELKDYIAKFSF